ncbi:MAG: glycosyltransferase [Phycisphaerae bacterium]|nr:glycosyltransferase [Phycisphaerae bacterium]
MKSINKKLKIAFIINQFPSVSETFILNQAIGFIERGHQVHIFAKHTKNCNIVHNNFNKFSMAQRTTYLPEFSNSKKIIRIKALFKLTSTALSNPLKAIKIAKLLLKNSRYFSYPLFYTLCNFKLNQYDFLYCHFGPNGNIGAFIKLLGDKAQLISVFPGYDLRLAEEKGGWIFEPAFENSDKLLVYSNAYRDKLLKYYNHPEKFGIIGCGLDTTRLPLPQPKTDDAINIISVGRLVTEKALHHSIKAFAKAAKVFPEKSLHYTIIGDGPLKSQLQQLANELEIDKKITFAGNQDHDYVVEKLVNSDIFLFSSESEALGTVLIEAQATGLPIVSTNSEGIKESVRDGISGFLVNSGDVEALAEKLVFFIKNPDIRIKMGQAGKQYATENFDNQILADKLQSIFYSLIE